MKKLLIIFFMMFLIGCSAKPYLQKTELPSNIDFYTEDKQFKITPEWFWRLRPSTESVANQDATIGHKFLNGKIGTGIVIGELNKEEKFFVIKWENQGYYFLREQDSIFAKKFQKYLVPLNYGGESIYGHTEISAYEIQDHLNEYYRKLNQTIFSARSSVNIKYANIDETKKSSLKQVAVIGRGYTNQFINVLPCPLFESFSPKEDTYYFKKISDDYFYSSAYYFVISQTGTKQYTNDYGQVFIGSLYQTQSVIVKWGRVFYSLPCE